MSKNNFSVRFDDQLIANIRSQYPDFGQKDAQAGYNSKAIRELIHMALGNDEIQEINHELAETRQELRDLTAEVKQQRKNTSVVLKLVLLNVGADPEKVERIMEALQEKGLIF